MVNHQKSTHLCDDYEVCRQAIGEDGCSCAGLPGLQTELGGAEVEAGGVCRSFWSRLLEAGGSGAGPRWEGDGFPGGCLW